MWLLDLLSDTYSPEKHADSTLNRLHMKRVLEKLATYTTTPRGEPATRSSIVHSSSIPFLLKLQIVKGLINPTSPLFIRSQMEWALTVLRCLLGLFKVSLKSFFFISEGNPSGPHLAAPNRFEFIRNSSSNAPQDYAYEEEVYDLEALRYPFKIRLMEDLPERMSEQLKKAITGKFVKQQLYAAWETWKERVNLETFRSKRSATRVVDATWHFLLPAFEMVHPNDRCMSDLDACSKDKRVAADIHFKLGSSGETVILGEALDPTIAEIYISDLVKLASGGLRSNFEGELPEKFVGHEAILAKLSYEIMDE
ncbi:hypothetical protein CPB86DRAFT_392699 [Serendipita vermifera]|nr:hypothetical protein CPB86DRAFT_392699 [Serendipita vermifera]